MPTIEVDGRPVAYTVRHSTRAKRLQVRYMPEIGFEVVLPTRVPLREVEPFLRGAKGWIRRTQEKAARSTPLLPIANLDDGASLPYLGEALHLRLNCGPHNTARREQD